MLSFFKRRKAQKACDAFNKANPVGTRVIRIGSIAMEPMPRDKLTYGAAYLDNNAAVVRLVGEPDSYPIDKLVVMPKRTPSAYSSKHTSLPNTYRRSTEPTPAAAASTFTDDFSSPAYRPTSGQEDTTPAIVSGGGGSFGGGGASSSWGDSGSSTSDSGSSSSDSGSSSSSD